MKQLKLLVIFCFIFLLISSCKKDPNVEPEELSGSYTLSSIETNLPIDSNADGLANDTELFDNVNCLSRIVFNNTDNTFVFDIMRISHDNYTNPTGFTNYLPLYCAENQHTNTYTITDNAIILNTEASFGENIIFDIKSDSEVHYKYTHSSLMVADSTYGQTLVTMKFTK